MGPNLAELEALAENLAQALEAAARELRASGRPPSEQLVDQGRRFREAVQQVASEINEVLPEPLRSPATVACSVELCRDLIRRMLSVVHARTTLVALCAVESDDPPPVGWAEYCRCVADLGRRYLLIQLTDDEWRGLTEPEGDLRTLHAWLSDDAAADDEATFDAAEARFGRSFAIALVRKRIRGLPDLPAPRDTLEAMYRRWDGGPEIVDGPAPTNAHAMHFLLRSEAERLGAKALPEASRVARPRRAEVKAAEAILDAEGDTPPRALRRIAASLMRRPRAEQDRQLAEQGVWGPDTRALGLLLDRDDPRPPPTSGGHRPAARTPSSEAGAPIQPPAPDERPVDPPPAPESEPRSATPEPTEETTAATPPIEAPPPGEPGASTPAELPAAAAPELASTPSPADDAVEPAGDPTSDAAGSASPAPVEPAGEPASDAAGSASPAPQPAARPASSPPPSPGAGSGPDDGAHPAVAPHPSAPPHAATPPAASDSPPAPDAVSATPAPAVPTPRTAALPTPDARSESDECPGRYGVEWRALRAGSPGLAAVVAHFQPTPGGPDVALLTAVGLAPHVDSPSDPAAQDLSDAIAGLAMPTRSDPNADALELLTWAALLRPAVLLQHSVAGPRLAELRLGQEPLELLRQRVLELSRLPFALTAGVLRGARDRAGWEARSVELARSAVEWRERERSRDVRFHAATTVWRRWLNDPGDDAQSPAGALTRPLKVVADDDRDARSVVAEAVSAWGEPAWLDTMIQRTDELNRAEKARKSPIMGPAHRALHDAVARTVGFLREWLAHLDEEPGRADDFRVQQVQAIRSTMDFEAAESCLDGLAATDDTVGAAAVTACALLGALRATLDPEVRPPVPWPVDDRAEALALTPGLSPERREVELGFAPPDDSSPWMGELAQIEALVELPATERRRRALAWHVELGDPAGWSTLLGRLPEAERAELEADPTLEPALRERLHTVRRNLYEASLRIERMTAQGLIPESTRLELTDELQRCELGVEQGRPSWELEARLAAVAARLAGIQAWARAEVERRIEALAPEAPNVQAARAALDKGHVEAAHEHLAALDVPAPRSPPPDPLSRFREFFPAVLDDLARRVEDHGVQRVVGELRGGGHGPDPWQRATRVARLAEGEQPERIREILTTLGFVDVEVRPRSAPARGFDRSFDVHCRPIADRRACPIPDLGSLARGRYRVYAIWDEVTPEAVPPRLPQLPGGASIVLLFGRSFGSSERRALARAFRSRGEVLRNTLVIDAALYAWVASQADARLGTLFACALPFAVSNPYAPIAGELPPEMFFGRQAEIASLLEERGAHLVYGGRQLGKTALLQHVKLRAHRPEEGSVAFYVDLRNEQIGTERPANDIWPLLVDRLVDHKVVPASARHARDPRTLGGHLETWLGADVRRRVLVLLDEADAFFLADERAGTKERYPNLLQLKQLMEATGRRFKLVFAGLHNVQRTARDVNTPLAHLGEPICIGPLLRDEDRNEARLLVSGPSGAMGYEFEDDDLVLQVLANTNWYPSLIQLFASRLFRGLASHSFPLASSPPWRLTRDDIENAFRSRELRDAILTRFRWTIELDRRYQCLALCIAHASLDGSAREEGFDVSWARDQALQYWPGGFPSRTKDTFATLLDEMVGLGVLRRTPSGRYALRSPNVLRLLGTREDVEEQLLELMGTEPAPEYDADKFRRARGRPWQRSTLTAAQESVVLDRSGHGVVVVFGAEASGLARVVGDLAAAHEIRAVPAEAPLREWLEREAADTSNPLHVFVVPPDRDWAPDDVRFAQAQLGRKQSQKSIRRVVFVGGPDAAWRWVESVPLDEEPGLARVIVLRRWQTEWLKRWAIEVGADDLDVERVLEGLGGWAEPILQLGERRSSSTSGDWDRALEEVVAEFRGALSLDGVRADILGDLAALGMADLEGLAAVAEREDAAVEVERVLRWAELLDAVERVDRREWRVVRKAIAAPSA